jgi:hypothetical protein
MENPVLKKYTRYKMKKKYSAIIFFGLFLLFLLMFVYINTKKFFLVKNRETIKYQSQNLFTYKKKQIRLKDSVLVLADIADTSELQAIGLSGRTFISDEEAMIFIFPYPEKHAFWMKGMIIPIDIFWINEGKIVHIEHSVKPPDDKNQQLSVYNPNVMSDMVLETKAGFAKNFNIVVGDKIEL